MSALRKITVVVHGITIAGTLITGAIEGDSDVPNGTRPLAPYLEDVKISDADGVAMEPYLSDDGIERLEQEAIGKVGE